MDTLYIIGNGFDLFHNLPTNYSDFYHYVVTTHTELENTFNAYFNFRSNDDYSWTNFEEDLGTFNWKSFYNDNCHINIQDEDFSPSFTFCLEDELNELVEQQISNIKSAFSDWLETVMLESVQKKIVLQKDAFYLSFNYTMTLEKVYKIQDDKILHIHKDIENNPEALIFGHNFTLKEELELDENGNNNRTLFTDSEAAAKTLLLQFLKPVKDTINENNIFFKSIKNVKKIFVLGHSLNQIDIPYFKEIFKRTKEMKWNVTYHQNDDIEKHVSALNQIGVSEDSIRHFKLTSC